MTDPITALVPWIPSGTFEDSVQLRQRLALGAVQSLLTSNMDERRLQFKKVAASLCAAHVHHLHTS